MTYHTWREADREYGLVIYECPGVRWTIRFSFNRLRIAVYFR